MTLSETADVAMREALRRGHQMTEWRTEPDARGWTAHFAFCQRCGKTLSAQFIGAATNDGMAFGNCLRLNCKSDPPAETPA
jgi:hypothetical protein